MKKFTIFLLTFLFFIGFIHVNAQKQSNDGGPMRASYGLVGFSNETLHCGKADLAEDYNAWVVFNPLVEDPIDPLSWPVIYWSTQPDLDEGDSDWNEIHLPNVAPGMGVVDNYSYLIQTYFGSFAINFNPLDMLNDNFPSSTPLPVYDVLDGKIYFYATINSSVAPGGLWSSYEHLVVLSVVPPPVITLEPEKLIGIICEDGETPEIFATLDWTLTDEEYGRIEYEWLLNDVVVADGTWEGVDFSQAPETVSYIFDNLPVGLNEIKFRITVYNLKGFYAATCDDEVVIEFYVSPKPEVTFELPTDLNGNVGVCENIKTITFTATPDFFTSNYIRQQYLNGAMSYGYEYALYIDDNDEPVVTEGDNLLSYKPSPGGNYGPWLAPSIPEWEYTADISELDPCEHEFKVTLTLYNTSEDPEFNLIAEQTCIGEHPESFTIWPLPVVELDMNILSVCSGDTIEIVATASAQDYDCIAEGPYQWGANSTPLSLHDYFDLFSFPDPPGNIQYHIGAKIETLSTIIDTLWVWVNDEHACSSLRDTVIITIHPLPVFDGELDLDEPICYNHDPFILGGFIVLDEFGDLYECPDCESWFGGPGVSEELDEDDVPTGSWIFNPADAAEELGGLGTGSWLAEIWYYFTSEFGCTDSISQEIEIFDLPVVPFEYEEELCARETLMPTFYPEDDHLPNGAITEWEFTIEPTTGVVIDPETGELDLWGADTGVYVITYTYYDGTCTNFSTYTIHVNPLPIIDSITMNVIPCEGMNAQLTAHVSYPEDLEEVSFEWWDLSTPSSEPIGTGRVVNIEGKDVDMDYMVYVTINETGCWDSLRYTVEPTLNPVEDIVFHLFPGPYCNNSIINLDAEAIIRLGFENTTQTYQWSMCEYGADIPGGMRCKDIDLTELSGQYKIEVDVDVEYVVFCIDFETIGYNCPDHRCTEPIDIIQTIKVDIVGSDIDTVCHGGSVEMRFMLSNMELDPELKTWYRILENNVWYEGVNEVHQVPPGSTEIWFITHPSLHTNENGPESYCYAVEVWQYPVAYVHMESPYPDVCVVTSECHWVTVLKDPEILLTCPGTIIKNPTENPVFTANLVGGVGEPYYFWYLNTELVQEGPDNTYELDDPAILGTLGDYQIAVKATQNYSGCDAEMVVCNFSVICPPMQVSIVGLDAACVGDYVTLTAVVITDAEYTIQWKKDGQLLPGETNLTLEFTVTEPVDMEHYVIEVSNCGCEIITAEHLFQVLPKTVIWVDDYTICENGAVEVEVNMVNWNSQVYRYVWFNAEGDEIDVTYVNHRVFKFNEIAFEDGIAQFSVQTEMLNSACSSNVAEFTITIMGALETVTLDASDTIICVGNPVLFTLGTDLNIGLGTPEYSWWIDGIQVDGESLDFLNISFFEVGMHYVNVRITYPDNICEFVSDDIAIEVREMYSVEINGPTEVCMTDVPVLLTAYVDPYAGDYKYQWYENGNTAGTDATQAINFAAGNYTYLVIVTDSLSGCWVQSEPFNVVVDKAPVITMTDVTETICQEDQFTFTAPVINNVTYKWFINGVEEPGAILNVFTYNFNEYGTFAVRVQAISNVLGCESTKVLAGTITVKAPPTVEIAGPDLVCNAADPTVLYAVVYPPDATVTFEWFENDEPVGTGSTQVISNIPNSVPYVYKVIITDTESGCTAQAVHSVLVEQFVTTGITADKTDICHGESVILTANVNGSNNFILQWYAEVGGQKYPIDGANDPILQVTPDQTTTYSFTATQIGSGCVSTSNEITITVTQIPMPPVLTISNTLSCSGDPVTITSNATGEHTWYINGNPVTTTPVAFYTDQPTANNVLTTYIYQAIVAVNGCASALSTPVSVVVHPEMEFYITGAHDVCDQALEDEHLVLHALPTTVLQPGVQYEYQWSYVQGNNPEKILLGSPNQNNWVQVPNNLPINDPAAPYCFIVEVRAIGYECMAVAPCHQVYVWPKPTVVITVDNESICLGGIITATAHPTPPPTPEYPYNYIWKINDIIVPGNLQTIPIANNFLIGVNEITVEIERAYASLSCFGTDAKLVNVLTQPSLDLSQNINGLQLPGMCVGGQINLFAELIDFDETLINIADFNYEWKRNGNPIANQPLTYSDILNTVGSYNYEVRAYLNNNLGCNADWTAFAPVKVVEQPTIQIATKDYYLYEVCQGATMELINTLGVTDPTIQMGYQYKWNDLDWAPFTNQIDPRTVTFDYTGTKKFFMYAEFANPTCLPVKLSNEINIDVKVNPYWTNYSINPDPYFGICLGETVNLNAAFAGGVTDGTNGGTIQWMYSFNGEPYVKLTDLGAPTTHTPVQAGSYNYMLTYNPVHELSGCAIDPVVLGPMEVEQTITTTARFVNTDTPQNCGNDPFANPVVLVIEFEGTAPFTCKVTDNFGSGYDIFSPEERYELVVRPVKTTTYTIESMGDQTRCTTGIFVKSYVTVTVTDVVVLNPHVEACDNKIEVELKMNAYVSAQAMITFPGVKPWYVPIIPYGETSKITIDIPAGTTYGVHDIIITIDGCDFAVTIVYNFHGTESYSLIHRRWEGVNEVLVVSNNADPNKPEFYNGGYEFTSYQWFKNGVMIPGATQAWYQDPQGINGSYSVKLTGWKLDDNGQHTTWVEFSTCEANFNNTQTINVFPVPAGTGQPVYVELDLTPAEMEGAYLDIYDAKGAHVSQVKVVGRLTQVNGFKAQGTYFGRITTGTNEIKAVRFLIVK